LEAIGGVVASSVAGLSGEQVVRVISGLLMNRRWNVCRREAPIREREE
jgi:hypothetical protein